MNWPLHRFSHSDLDSVDFFHVARFVTDKFFGGGEINPRVRAIQRCGLFLAVIEPVNLRPFGPRIVLRAVHRRLGQNFDLHQALAAMTHRSANAIGAGVATADDDHILAGGR